MEEYIEKFYLVNFSSVTESYREENQVKELRIELNNLNEQVKSLKVVFKKILLLME